MKKLDITRRMARQAGVSEAEAADRLDRVVHQILSDLRKGRATQFPGLGRFVHGADGRIAFEPERGPGHD